MTLTLALLVALMAKFMMSYLAFITAITSMDGSFAGPEAPGRDFAEKLWGMLKLFGIPTLIIYIGAAIDAYYFGAKQEEATKNRQLHDR